MATPAGERQRLILLVAAVAVAALGVSGWRVVSGSRKVAARPLPVSDIQGMSSFLGPLSDTTSLAQGDAGTMVVNRDPFLPPAGTGQNIRPSPPAAGPPKDVVTRGWVVSSILFEDSRRSAIVDNQWVSVGDALGGGARVTAIERKHVVVTDANGVRHVVPIKGGNL